MVPMDRQDQLRLRSLYSVTPVVVLELPRLRTQHSHSQVEHIGLQPDELARHEVRARVDQDGAAGVRDVEGIAAAVAVVEDVRRGFEGRVNGADGDVAGGVLALQDSHVEGADGVVAVVVDGLHRSVGEACSLADVQGGW